MFSSMVERTNAKRGRWFESVNIANIHQMSKYRYYIGIDTGVNTGVAIWDSFKKEFTAVGSMTIHRAFDIVKQCERAETFVRVEDARQRKWFPKKSQGAIMGAGSIKRDAKIWEDFLTDEKVYFEMVAPKDNMTKLKDEAFKKMTKWNFSTNEHARDAAMLVFGK